MKKIALCSLLACMVSTFGYAENTCRVSKIYDGHDASSDEYLFPTNDDYLIAGVIAEVYECDKINSASCTDKEVITMPAGHYYKGNRVAKEQTYKCDAWTVGDDSWEPYTPAKGEIYNTCDKKKMYDGHDATSDEYLFADAVNYKRAKGATAKVYECDKIATTSCQDQEYITMPAGHVFKGNVVGESRKYKCEALTIGNDKWVPVAEGESITPTPNPKPGSCTQFKAYPERYACCIKGSATTWTGPASSGTCTCVDKTKEWKYSNGTGVCQAKSGGDEGGKDDTTPETTKQCWYSFSADVRCANGASISKASGFYVDTKAATCEEFTRLYKDDQAFMMEMAEKYCSQHPELPVVDDKAFNAAKDSINAFFNNAKSDASVWKNAEGKFNTARLASDLTAGVVLGTVGGVVSGVVIKKKQVEKGFDALHCTVGGQKVADWGDEFNIGLRK